MTEADRLQLIETQGIRRAVLDCEGQWNRRNHPAIANCVWRARQRTVGDPRVDLFGALSVCFLSRVSHCMALAVRGWQSEPRVPGGQFDCGWPNLWMAGLSHLCGARCARFVASDRRHKESALTRWADQVP